MLEPLIQHNMAAGKVATHTLGYRCSLLLLSLLLVVALQAEAMLHSSKSNQTMTALATATSASNNATGTAGKAKSAGSAAATATAAPKSATTTTTVKSTAAAKLPALSADELDGRSAFINNEYIPDVEPPQDGYSTPPLFQLLQQQMEQILAANGAEVVDYVTNKQLTAGKQPPSNGYGVSLSAPSSSSAYINRPSASSNNYADTQSTSSNDYAKRQSAPSNGYTSSLSAPSNNYVSSQSAPSNGYTNKQSTTSSNSFMDSQSASSSNGYTNSQSSASGSSSSSSSSNNAGALSRPALAGYTVDTFKDYMEGEEDDENTAAAVEMVAPYAREQEKLFHVTPPSKATTQELPKPMSTLTNTYGGVGLSLRPNKFAASAAATTTTTTTTTSTTAAPARLSDYALPPLPALVPLVKPPKPIAVADEYAPATGSKYSYLSRSNSTIHMRKRRITFKTVSSASQIISTPLADLMFKFSIGIAKPTMAAASGGGSALNALTEQLPLRIAAATTGYSGNLDLPKRSRPSGYAAKSSSISNYKAY